MVTKGALIGLMTFPLLAQVSQVAFSESKDVVPAFNASGRSSLQASRLKLDVAYPRGKQERCELTVLYDPDTGHYLWHHAEPNPGVTDDTAVYLSGVKAHRAVAFAESAGMLEVIFAGAPFVKIWRGRANNLDSAIALSTNEIRQGLAVFEGIGYHRDYKLIPVFGPALGFDSKAPPDFKPISKDFMCAPRNSYCPEDKNTIASISKQGSEWRIVFSNRFDVEVILDQNLDLVSAKQLTQPKPDVSDSYTGRRVNH